MRDGRLIARRCGENIIRDPYINILRVLSLSLSPSCPPLFIPFCLSIAYRSRELENAVIAKPLRDDYVRRFINFFPALPLPSSHPAKSIFFTSGSISASAKCFFLILLVHLTYSLLVDRDNRTRARSGDGAV